MKKRSKKYTQAITLIDKNKLYSINEAVDLLESTNTVKFDPSIEIHFNLGIDPKVSEQQIRTTISLPHGTGKAVKIGAFTDSGNEKELKSAGAFIAGGDDLIEIVSSGKIDFDVAIATPSIMKKMGKVAKVLGPKGLMPNPKAGTVGEDLILIIKELLAGKIEFKNDKQGLIHSIVGKLSFGQDKIRENIEYFIKVVKEIKPSGIKGNYIISCYVCSTMGPGIKLDI